MKHYYTDLLLEKGRSAGGLYFYLAINYEVVHLLSSPNSYYFARENLSGISMEGQNVALIHRSSYSSVGDVNSGHHHD